MLHIYIYDISRLRVNRLGGGSLKSRRDPPKPSARRHSKAPKLHRSQIYVSGHKTQHLHVLCVSMYRSQWPRGLRRRCAVVRLLRSWFRIPPGACIFVCCDCCVLSGRGLCDELITRPEKSYRLWCVVVCDLETSRMRRPLHALGRSATANK